MVQMTAHLDWVPHLMEQNSGLGFRGIVENQMENRMENEMDIGII